MAWQKRAYTKPVPIVRAPRKTYTPSVYQQNILDWLTNDTGNLSIIATAGSGKTSTLEMLAYAMPTNAKPIFLAFSKAIATELTTRLPFPASTFHALCFKALGASIRNQTGRFAPLDANKVNGILDNTYGREINEIRSLVCRLVSLAKNENETPNIADETLCDLVARHDLDLDSDEYSWRDVYSIVRSTLQACVDNVDTVDFDDMIWLVERRNVRLETYTHVLVDEAQDTNPLQRALLRRCMSPNTRLIAVGDHAQAIYGFRGASSDALELISSEFHTKELPLTVSYRCPVSVVKLAQKYGNIEAAPNAKEGSVTFAKSAKLTDFTPGDLVLCRNTAPLVQVAYRLIAARIPAQIKGRDIGVALTSLIKKLAGKKGTLETLTTRVQEYQTVETEKALSKRKETLAQSISDKCESILALIDGLTPDDCANGVQGLIAVVDSLFADTDGRGKVLLSTIHKSKGLEAQSVKILDWKLCPSKYARQAWQQQQERNLQFVAITRSMDVLTFIDTETLE